MDIGFKGLVFSALLIPMLLGSSISVFAQGWCACNSISDGTCGGVAVNACDPGWIPDSPPGCTNTVDGMGIPVCDNPSCSCFQFCINEGSSPGGSGWSCCPGLVVEASGVCCPPGMVWNGATCSNPCNCNGVGWDTIGTCGNCGEGAYQRWCDGCNLVDNYQCSTTADCVPPDVQIINGPCGPGNCGDRLVRNCDDVSCTWRGWNCEGQVPFYGQNCNCNACGSCGGTYDCSMACSGGTPPNPANYGNPCGTRCGIIGCDGVTCTNEGICSAGATQCTGTRRQTCNVGCSAWVDTGTDIDGDGVDAQCGDSLCDNTAGITDSTRLPNEVGRCTDNIDNDCDGNTDCADSDCAGVPCTPDPCPGPSCDIGCQSAINCPNDDCVAESCTANVCQNVNRSLCDGTECAIGSYCNAPGGNCQDADSDQTICTTCAVDQTPPLWNIDVLNQRIDAGIAWGAEYFDSNPSACGGGTCTKPGCDDPGCYDRNAVITPINRVQSLPTGPCCGDDLNEYLKTNYFGPECVSSADFCVWPDGTAQPPNSGNAQWWCNPGDWYECNDATIGMHDPPDGMCCVGVPGDNEWLPIASLPGENTYVNGCTDNVDNDCDGAIDCDDTNCAGTIGGFVTNQNGVALYGVSLDLKNGSTTNQVVVSAPNGRYDLLNVKCTVAMNPPLAWDVASSHPDYWPTSVYGISIAPNENRVLNLQMNVGTSCESDCTYVADSTVHGSCDGHSGCDFYDNVTQIVCDNSKPGWLRNYNDTHYVVCALGTPSPKTEIQASVNCASGTIVKVTRIVVYNGKPVKLVVATCG